ncbi:hypothetical protein pb186bvf_008822 [Paramecium bursaria]
MLINSQKESFQMILEPESACPWKILVFDNCSQRILSTLYRVGDLREKCITLHLNLNQKRERLYGVLTLYLIKPSIENINLIIEDFQRDLYQRVIINFIHPITDIEYLAKELSKIPGAVQKIQKIYEHNLDFISLNQNLFELNENSDTIQSLLSIIITMKVQPVLIFNRRNQDHPALKLIDKLNQLTFQNEQPQLIVYFPDREDDFNPIIAHSNSYIALLHDIFQIKYNKVTVDGQAYDLSPIYDKIWNENSCLPINQASEKINKDLLEWKQQYDIIKAQSDLSDNLQQIELVPQINMQKRLVEQHINIAASIYKIAKQRQLDKYFQLCQNILSQSELSVEGVNFENDSDIDKLRVILLMIMNQYSLQDVTKWEGILNIKDKKFIDLINYYKNKFDIFKQQQQGQTNKFKQIFKGIANQVSSKSKGFIKNVSNFLPSKDRKYQLLQLIDSLFYDQLRFEEVTEYLKIWDSRTSDYVTKQFDVSEILKINDILIFYSEGACYNEYVEIQETERVNKKNIIYGGSFIQNAEELIKLQIQKFIQ